jgi:ribonuclease P protein subunit POP4
MITTENIIRHELIGLETSVMRSTNLQIMGLHGKIVDETRSMFVIETHTGVKHVPKENSVWEFSLNGSMSTVDGKSILKRSYERIGVKA